jgi:molybdenum cofactor guanylyltransferase
MTPPARHEDVSACILAGGRSRRMGRDKAFLPLAGKPMLARVADAARPLVACVSVVADAGAEYGTFGVAVVPDARAGRCGPLAGIETALTHAETPYVLILACDLPLVSTEFLRLLLARRGAAAVVPESAPGRRSGVCAVYPRSALATATELLDAGVRRMDAFLARIPVTVMPFSDYAGLPQAAALLTNVNTPEDYAALVRAVTEA